MTPEKKRSGKAADVRPVAPPAVADNLLVLLQERALNLRQLFWRAHRGLNEKIIVKFAERGYAGLRPAHLTVLGNMSLEETPSAKLAERAQISVGGINAIAEELQRLGYIRIERSHAAIEDMRINFTDAGWEVMLTSFNILREIEAEYAAKLQKGDLEQLRRIFDTLFGR